jgi:hypothetical protein
MQISPLKCKHCTKDILDHLDNSKIRDQDGKIWLTRPQVHCVTQKGPKS